MEPKLHNLWIRWRGKTFHLPKGAHGERNPEIERGHIKKMIRHLEISVDCAKEHLEQIR